jgi:hypothetical protein
MGKFICDCASVCGATKTSFTKEGKVDKLGECYHCEPHDVEQNCDRPKICLRMSPRMVYCIPVVETVVEETGVK